MTYTKFFKLDYLKFRRSPNFSTKVAQKILSIFGYLLFALYMFILPFLLYFVIKKKFPEVDVFQKSNTFLFVYFFIVFYTMMYLSFDSMQVKPFMILPLKKSKIVLFQIIKIIVHPINVVFSLMLLILLILVYNPHSSIFGLTAWYLSVLLTTFFIEIILFFSSRNSFFNVLMGLMIFVIIYKMQWLSEHLGFIGAFFYKIYTDPYLIIWPLIFFVSAIAFLYYYLKHHFYLDDAIKKQKKQKVKSLNLSWTEKYGLIGSFVRNDVRLIWRNIRPRQALPGFFIFYVMVFFMFSKYGQHFQQPDFNKVLFLLMLTGFFVIQFGNFIPAWDSEYYPLLMSQSISYRQYLEAKWWLMAVSILVISILALPFLFISWQVYVLILALAIFNLGVNLPLTLLTGAYRQTPIKLNEKVKAFQNRESFKIKSFTFAILKLFVPIIIFILIKNYAGYLYGIIFLFILGLIGLLSKNWFLDRLSRLYIQRKYITLEGFKKIEE